MRTKLMLLGTICLLLLLYASCKKKHCSRGDNKEVYTIKATNWEWFNYPEGTRIAYENNLGDKDTAVFGAAVFSEEEGNFYEKECYTQYNQKITQDITWINSLKGRLRPVQIIRNGYANDGISIKYSNENESEYRNNQIKDTLIYDNKKYSDIISGCCAPPPSRFYDYYLSKSTFYLKISFLLSDNTIETWQRK